MTTFLHISFLEVPRPPHKQPQPISLAMATFLTNLWESIFTPGPTPTLLIATNITFFSLQILFLALLIATHSFHFVALSILSAGLWWGINWFATELKRAKEIEEEAEKIRKRRRSQEGPQSEETSGGEAGPESEEEGTETEREKTPAPAPQKPHKVHVVGGPMKIQGIMESARRAQQAREEYAREHPEVRQRHQESGSTTGAKLKPEDAGEASKRRSLGESQADLSSSTTDSEWEKVSESGEKEKER